MNIQVNNGQILSVSNPNGSTDTNHAFHIGRFINGAALDGRVDEVAIYKRLLTPAERTWLYNNGLGRTYSEVNPPQQTGWEVRAYDYDESHPHAVEAVSSNQLSIGTYEYDENGNPSTGSGQA